ncbi:uncharacterized protein LOC126555736 [Aphis gossypii]|uniref:uncharacterized protein LOC126555736 n=1 Tax=Aphis gossypii TaxID=80765 RepID=UPI002158D9F0|nr:uncharacterized protein LOC126555736 [Aphis gossypii]
MGPYPRTSRGKQYLLVATDMFSRWTEAYPLGTATTKTITETTRKRIFSPVRIPPCVPKRQRPPICSERYAQRDRTVGSRGLDNPDISSEGQPVERRNQDIKKGLRALLAGGNHNTWDAKIPPILFSIRNRRNDQTGFPPSVLVLGREMKRPGEWALTRSTDSPIEQINVGRESRERHVLEITPATGDQTCTAYTTGDTVYYKAHHRVESTPSFTPFSHPSGGDR